MKKKKAKVNVKVLDFSEFVKQINQKTVLPKVQVITWLKIQMSLVWLII